MPLLPSRFLRVLRDRRLPARARVDLAQAELRRKLLPRASYSVHIDPSTIRLSHDDYDVDWKSLAFVFVDEPYATDYAGSLVLDLGAHKGYYAAYAFARGAHTVISFEPESANLDHLERAAASLRAPGRSWFVRRAAVGPTTAEADLHVMGASWGHALHPPDHFAEYETGSERVRVEAMADVLAEATELARGDRLLVKLNVEGEECPTILETPASAWEVVDEVFVETHPWATCGADELATHLAAAGLSPAESLHPLVLRMRRAPGAPAGRRSASR